MRQMMAADSIPAGGGCGRAAGTEGRVVACSAGQGAVGAGSRRAASAGEGRARQTRADNRQQVRHAWASIGHAYLPHSKHSTTAAKQYS